MRAFAACLTVCLGFGVFSAVGCSSDATTGGTGAEGGEAGAPTTPSAGKSGGSSAGATSTAGAPSGEGGAGGDTCAYNSDACTGCLTDKCGTEVAACGNDAACGGGILPLRSCACDGTSTIDKCEMDFAMTGGDPAAVLVTCFNQNCAASCM